jgi:hypothetical protein
MTSIRVTRKESTMGCSIDLDHHDKEGELHDGVRRWGGRGGERELEGGGKFFGTLKGTNLKFIRVKVKDLRHANIYRQH